MKLKEYSEERKRGAAITTGLIVGSTLILIPPKIRCEAAEKSMAEPPQKDSPWESEMQSTSNRFTAQECKEQRERLANKWRARDES
jgi:hypothetical protein